MERSCKNCHELIYAGKSHCSNCGAKWLENRITMRQVAADFSDMYLGFDTKFVRTFVDLFKKPQAVINGYINGRRVYYMDAVRYMILALFLTGIYIFVMRNSDSLNEFMADFQQGWSQAAPDEDNTKAFEVQEKVTGWILDYMSMLTLFSLPLLALIGRITFWGKRYYNFTEQVVFYLYTFAHITIFTMPISILLIWVSPEVYWYWSFLNFPIMLIYTAYCYKKCFHLNLQTTILKTLIAIFLVIITFIIFIVILMMLIAAAVVIYDKLGYDVKAIFS